MDFDVGEYLRQRGDLEFRTYGVWKLDECLQFAVQDEILPCEVKAVFACTKVRGPGTVKEAVVKIKLQYPESHYDSDSEKAKQPTTELHRDTLNELSILKHLTECACPRTPQLLDYLQEEQQDNGCLPHGYAIYMLMTKLPGHSPLWFWNANVFTRERRDNLRADFITGLFDLYDYGVTLEDKHVRNLLWDEENRKCYFVDFEHAKIDWSNYINEEIYLWDKWDLIQWRRRLPNGKDVWEY